jgi:methylenetetrahydromethanopterin dehydrogenase
MVKVGFIKLGNIGMSLIVNLLLDERADREDIDVRVAGTGAKMGKPEAEDVLSFLHWDPELLIVISPNAALPGPRLVREAFEGKPCIVISDGPAKKAVDAMKEKGFGYIILPGDPMIGARREFLDPTEMALFNTDVLKVLSSTGAAKLVQDEIDRVIDEIKAGGEVTVPQIIATAEVVTRRAKFSNPYAQAKAIAAYSMAEKVGELDAKACFMMKDPEAYTIMVAAAHELIREAALLADEARELEKGQNTVSRSPHGRSGELLSKRGLMETLK